MICWIPNIALFAINIESEWKYLIGILFFLLMPSILPSNFVLFQVGPFLAGSSLTAV